jgi:acyl-coenzyme A thioesterase PaaI-like protein
MTDALFTPDGKGRFTPSDHTRGPWDPGAMHGGAPSALLGGVMEALPSDTPMAVVRTTVEIFRPVPVRPVSVSARIERSGRRVQLLSAVLSGGDTELCRASAWRMRVTDLDVGVQPVHTMEFAGPGTSTPHVPESDEPAFHRTGVAMRYAVGSFLELGPSTVWMRLAMPVVAGEVPSPLQRTLAAADFGNGVSSAVPWGEFLFVNTDLTVYLHRQPEGEWVCLDATTDVDRRGIGLAHSRLYDEHGPIGHSLQALFVDRLRTAPPGI